MLEVKELSRVSKFEEVQEDVYYNQKYSSLSSMDKVQDVEGRPFLETQSRDLTPIPVTVRREIY